MTQPTIPDALAAGRVDAAVLSEPWLYAGKQVARVLAPAYDAIAPHFLVGVFFANLDWAKANAPTAARFQSAIAKTAMWANAHHEQSGAILEKYGKYPPGAVASMLRIAYQPTLAPSDIQPLIDVLSQYGPIPQLPPADKMIFRPS
jgi:ABC-type nitrate/sulfonate/bicarbonate transport system substrate-binding protein